MTEPPNADARPSLAIIGGGLSGLAAAVAAVEQGFRVELFERAQALGGRAGSFIDNASGQLIDSCAHVAMGCCTAFLDFCRRTGIDDCFARAPLRLNLVAPDGKAHTFAASRWLPAPWHLLPGLLRMSFLSPAERWRIVGALREIARRADIAPRDRSETIGAWLQAQSQSERAREWFWSPILTSALGETLDHASVSAARQVFCEGFLASRAASDLVLPRQPLRTIFHDRVGRWLTTREAKLHLGARVRRIEGAGQRADAIVLADGTRCPFDALVVAVPWRETRSLFTQNLAAALPALADFEQIAPAGITAVHLWYDRPVMPWPHAMLLGGRGHWVFADGPRVAGDGGDAAAQHCHVVLSASHRMAAPSHDALVDEIRQELERIWPAAAGGFRRGRVVAQPQAVFSVQPGVARWRPPQQTPIANLALAGDATATGWPATMESAVRSGFLAVKALVQARRA